MEPLKNMYDRAFIDKVAYAAETAIDGFDTSAFVAAVFAPGWEELELKQRVRRISTALHSVLSGNYPHDVTKILDLTAAVLNMDRGYGFGYMFIPDYIEQYGTGHFDLSMQAMEQVTILCSCEFAIRPYIIGDMKAALAIMLAWTEHPHASVRRLASEGCRPRLPWAMALPPLKKDPTPILPILERLKDDPSEFVRRSVANNINDIVKDNPGVALALAHNWKGHARNTDWIIKHGCRTLLKRGDAVVLKLFGLSTEPECRVNDLALKHRQIRIGEHLHFSFALVNEAATAMPLRIEYAITYAKANNKQGRKIFKITENSYHPATEAQFARRQSFADVTTRKHYAGPHVLEIVVNGCSKARAEFEVIA